MYALGAGAINTRTTALTAKVAQNVAACSGRKCAKAEKHQLELLPH